MMIMVHSLEILNDIYIYIYMYINIGAATQCGSCLLILEVSRSHTTTHHSQ